MKPSSPTTPRKRFEAWRCLWCGWTNNRDHEGLDECDHCHSETATAYQHDGSLAVKWAREPKALER